MSTFDKYQGKGIPENSRGDISGEQNEKLSGINYVTKPLSELISHSDYDSDALTAAWIVAGMSTEQLKELRKVITAEGDIYHAK